MAIVLVIAPIAMIARARVTYRFVELPARNAPRYGLLRILRVQPVG